METKWTPGPWALDGKTSPTALFIGGAFHRIASEDARTAFVPDWSGDDAEAAEAIANAHLIAAAPDLYAALEMAHLWLDFDGRFDMQVINAALAKARGEA